MPRDGGGLGSRGVWGSRDGGGETSGVGKGKSFSVMRSKSSAGRAGCSFGFSRMFISRPLISDCSDSADADEGIDENHKVSSDGPGWPRCIRTWKSPWTTNFYRLLFLVNKFNLCAWIKSILYIQLLFLFETFGLSVFSIWKFILILIANLKAVTV